jgi:hypothetical protein
MKYLIKESQIDTIIRNYLDNNYYPDYGWLEPEDYKEEFENWDEIYFEVNDHIRYKYVSGKLTVGIAPDLDGYFGDIWKEIFRTWFEEHTGLRVYEYKVID